MIETNLLAQFVAFAKAGTLTRAAQDLHTSQPALTRSMKKLEEELGVPLFVRHQNHLGLTQTGRYAVYYAQRVLQENQDFCDRIRSYDRSLHTLSIGYCAPVPQMVLTPLLNGIFQGMTLLLPSRKACAARPINWPSCMPGRTVMISSSRNAAANSSISRSARRTPWPFIRKSACRTWMTGLS